MTRTDPDTKRYYSQNAQQYADRTQGRSFSRRRESFMSEIVPGANILELGCGSGQDALTFLEHGFTVTALDASAELAEITRATTGLDTIVGDIRDINFDAAFDGIWASASLLHIPSDDLAETFSRIARSLRPGGLFAGCFKAGDRDWRDDFGRYFCAMNEQRFEALLTQSGLVPEAIESQDGRGSDDKTTTWIWGFARRPAS